MHRSVVDSTGTEVQIKHLRISSELFEKGYAAGEGPCKCTSTCCEGGVLADVTERKKILAHKDMIRRYMDETQPHNDADWFEQQEHDDADFPSGRCVGTTEHNNKCAFLDKIGRCSIQVAATSEGMHKWALKPLFCILFPIEISDRLVSFDPMLQDDEQCCTISSEFDTPLFEAAREELVHLLGEDGYADLEKHFVQTSRKQPLINEKVNP